MIKRTRTGLKDLPVSFLKWAHAFILLLLWNVFSNVINVTLNIPLEKKTLAMNYSKDNLKQLLETLDMEQYNLVGKFMEGIKNGPGTSGNQLTYIFFTHVRFTQLCYGLLVYFSVLSFFSLV